MKCTPTIFKSSHFKYGQFRSKFQFNFYFAGFIMELLKEQCHKDFAVLGQCAKIVTLRL